jgi:hypothetical protein
MLASSRRSDSKGEGPNVENACFGGSTGEEATVFEVARVTNAAFGALFGRSDDTAEPLYHSWSG